MVRGRYNGNYNQPAKTIISIKYSKPNTKLLNKSNGVVKSTNENECKRQCLARIMHSSVVLERAAKIITYQKGTLNYKSNAKSVKENDIVHNGKQDCLEAGED